MAWGIDPAHSEVQFEIKYMMFTTVRGRFKTFSGVLDVNEKDLEQSKIEGVVEIASIDTGEQKRDEHLRSADFFEVEKYPTITYRNILIERLGYNHYKALGDLTMHGVTHRVSFDVTLEGRGKDPQGNARLGFSAHTKLHRKHYGLNWNIALEAGGVLVGDEVKIVIDLQLVQQQVEAAAQKEAQAEAVTPDSLQ